MSKIKRVRTPPKKGQRFGLLTAVSEIGRDERGNLKWLFRCDCGREVRWRVSTARSNAKNGWCSCAECYWAAGGAEVFSKKANDLGNGGIIEESKKSG